MSEIERVLNLEMLESEIFKNTKILFRHRWDDEDYKTTETVLKVIIGNMTSTGLFLSNLMFVNFITEYLGIINPVFLKEIKSEAEKIIDILKEVIDKELEKETDKNRAAIKSIGSYLAIVKLLKYYTYSLVGTIIEENYEKTGEIGAEILNYDGNLEKDV